jgi:hypothetical protein
MSRTSTTPAKPLPRDGHLAEPAARTSHARSLAFWLAYVAIALATLTTFSGKVGSCQTGEDLRGLLCIPGSLGTFFWQCLVVGAYLSAVAAIYACSRIRAVYAVPLVIALWVLLAVDVGFYLAAGRTAGLPDIAVLSATSVSDIPGALATFTSAVGESLVLTSMLLAPILFRSLTTRHHRHVAVFVVPFLLLVGIYLTNLALMATRGFGETFLDSYPPGFSYGFGSAGTAIARALTHEAPALPVAHDALRPTVDRIIVVVDESVAHSTFSRLTATRAWSFIDYGRAMSGANCSAAANFVIRTAGWTSRANDRGSLNVKRIESLFALAKRAGYRTVFIDNQHYFRGIGGGNYFGADEIRQIDSVIQPDGEAHTRDTSSIATVSQLLERHPKLFVFVNKMGSHVPYGSTIPPDLRSPDGDKTRDYQRSVEYNSVNYLESLSHRVDAKTALFYTSDHGQAFAKSLAHCNTQGDVSTPEYLVPLLLMTGDPVARQALLDSKTTYENKLSHLEFSESIRNVMGYSVAGIDSVFKPPTNLDRDFCGVWGSPQPFLGIKPRCHVVR